MTNPRDQKTNESYWKYLEDNSKVVSTWPSWLKGDRPDTVDAQEQESHPNPEEQKLAS